MNQSVIFGDSCQWDTDRSSVHFVAQQQGMTIDCYINLAALLALSGLEEAQPQQVIALFEQFRFDIEDRAQELIDQEAVDEQGCLVINSI
ncbi:DUF1488 domain-containing protein [Shewanella mesophila]|uniref:DUF1488 domain-containing protein n=1 Tax=Shewanella mesophila TaxID=2864208 RepID=UPI001C65DB64|nr:DUF1488 domain-containing protein [Shewanella mesophila]QYJ86102.1 DUF1488 domain-containing protein [Shewanella mesophila]